MSVAVAVIGKDHWEDLTLPFIRSVREHEDVPIVVVSVASKYPAGDWTLINIPECSYAASMNAACVMFELYDWLVICNNDVICEGRFEGLLEAQEPGLYGGKMQRRAKPNFLESGRTIQYLTGDITGLHGCAYRNIGPFDSAYEGLGGCEDIDYSLRAAKLGLLKDAILPFRHLGLHHRKRRPDYRKTVDGNRARLLGKMERGEL